MKKYTEKDSLNEKISLLQYRRAYELEALKEQFYVTYERLKPINLIKNTLHEVASSQELKGNLVNNLIGLATGYLSKKVLVGSSHNPIKRFLGALLQFAIANVISKHSDVIKSTGEKFLKRMVVNKNETKHEFSDYEI